MRKILVILLLLVSTAAPVSAQLKKEVVIFSQLCHYCELMKEDLNNVIMAANPDITFTVLDIQEPENYKLLRQYAARHKLYGELGLPLLFVGENYIMGWAPESGEKLQEYIEQLRQENFSRFPASHL